MDARDEQEIIDAESARTAEGLRDLAEAERREAEADREEAEADRAWAEEDRRRAEDGRTRDSRLIAGLRARVEALERIVADLREERGTRGPGAGAS
jgi:hypothetical protein